MKVRTISRAFLILLFCVAVTVPFFSSELGIPILGGKINIADLVMFGFCTYSLALFRNFRNALKNAPEMKWWLIITLLWGFAIPQGMLNGASLGECIRLVRNLIYIPGTYLFFNKYVRGKEEYILIILSMIVSINTLVNAITLYRINNWFKFYRVNGVLTVFLVCYLLFRILESETIRNCFWEVLCSFLLLLASFFSQERTQLLTVGVSCLFVFFVRLLRTRKCRVCRRKAVKNIGLFFIGIIALALSFDYIIRIGLVKEYIDYYFTYRLQSGGLFQSGWYGKDLSAQARVLQLKTIISNNMNPFNFFLGRGTCSYYLAAQGWTYIVDSAFLWIFKDLGVVGVCVLVICVYQMLKFNNTIKNMYCVMAGGISLVVFMIYNPSFVYSTSVGFAIGLFAFLKSQKALNTEEQRKTYFEKNNTLRRKE